MIKLVDAFFFFFFPFFKPAEYQTDKIAWSGGAAGKECLSHK